MYKKNFSSFKKAIITFLALVFIFVNMTIPALAIDTSGDTEYLDAITLLEKLGILVPEDQMQYSEETVSREDFAGMVGVFYGFLRDDAGATAAISEFSDVDITTPNYGNIEFAVSMGVLDVDSDGSFRPSQDLTVGEAVKAMLVILGYNQVNPQNDDAFYRKQGQSLKLLSGIRSAYNSPITKGELVKILTNSLDTGILKMDSMGSSASYTAETDKTLLNERFGTYKLSGVLQATSITGIGTFGAVRKGHILLGGYDIETDEDFSDFLGMYITAYCKGNENLTELELLYGFPMSGRNKTLIVNTGDVTGVKGDTLYYELDERSKKVKIPNTATIIYNGKNYPLYSFATFMVSEKTREGNVTFLDSDSDGKYETIFIKSYETYFVDHIYKNDESVSFIGDNGNSLYDFIYDEDDNSKHYSFLKNGNTAALSDIGNKVIVSVAADKYDTNYEFLISDKYVEGDAGSIREDEIKIGDTVYKKIMGFDNSVYTVFVGEEARFYLNSFGNVAAIEQSKNQKNAYGILEKVKVNRREKCIKYVQIFTSEGLHKTFECAEKVKIDGKRYKGGNPYDIVNALNAAKTTFFASTGLISTGADDALQLIKYSTNSNGEIVSIDTIVPNSEASEDELKFSEKLNTGLNNYRWFDKAYAKTFNGRYVYDSNLVIFAMPDDKSQTDAFTAKKGSMNVLGYEHFSTGDEPSAIYVFDLEDNLFVPILLVEKTIATTVPQYETANMMILEKQVVMYNEEEGEVYRVIEGTSVVTGNKIKAYMTEDVYNTEYLPKGIVPGDVVRWSNDAMGVVNCVELFIDNIGPNSKITYGTAPRITTTNDTAYYNTTRFTCGTVEFYNNKYILFINGYNADNTPKYSASLINPSAKVLVYDSETKTTSVGDYSMIRTTKQSSTNPSLVFTYQVSSAINSIVIFR